MKMLKLFMAMAKLYNDHFGSISIELGKDNRYFVVSEKKKMGSFPLDLEKLYLPESLDYRYINNTIDDGKKCKKILPDWPEDIILLIFDNKHIVGLIDLDIPGCLRYNNPEFKERTLKFPIQEEQERIEKEKRDKQVEEEKRIQKAKEEQERLEKEKREKELEEKRAQNEKYVEYRFNHYKNFLLKSGAKEELIELPAIKEIILDIIRNGDPINIFEGRSPISYYDANEDGTFDIYGKMSGYTASVVYKMEYCDDEDCFIKLTKKDIRGYVLDKRDLEPDKYIYIDYEGNIINESYHDEKPKVLVKK